MKHKDNWFTTRTAHAGVDEPAEHEERKAAKDALKDLKEERTDVAALTPT